jgi:hypothetical protein
MSQIIADCTTDLPGYQRRLTATGLLARYRLSRDVTNLTGAGLALADHVTSAFLRRVQPHWPTDIVAHPAITTDPLPRAFAMDTSPEFDGYQIGDAGWLVFDCNIAHLDWLRARRADRPGPRAVATTSGIYRPVASTQNLIRDEFISPFVGMHLAVPRSDIAATWDRITGVLAEFAAAIGIPLLLAWRTPPAYYARSCLAALLPAPSGWLEPWLLAYELGDRFDRYFHEPATAVLEIGMSGRVLAFTAALQQGRTVAFGSEVMPTQLFTPVSSGEAVRTRPRPVLHDRTLPLHGLALVDHRPDTGTYRSLVDDYRTTHPWPGTTRTALDTEDRRLRAKNAALLIEAVTRRYTLRPRPNGPEHTLVTHAPDPSWTGQYLLADTPAN